MFSYKAFVIREERLKETLYKHSERKTFFSLVSAGAFNNVTHLFVVLCVRMCDFATQTWKKKNLCHECSFSDQTNTCREYVCEVVACVCLCLCKCYSPKAAIITDDLYTLVCLSLCAPFSCPLRNVDYRLDLVAVQQCDDVAQNVRCHRLH